MKKLISVLLISIVILSSCCVVSNAANVADLVFTSNATSVDVGSQITISLEINGVSGISELYGMAGKLSYDTNTFELVSVTGVNGWKVSTGNIISIIRDDSATSGRVMEVVLKAIKTPDAGSSVLTLTNVSVVDSMNEYEQTDVTYTINVKDAVVTPDPDTTPDTEPDTEPDTTPDTTPDKTPDTTPDTTPAPVQNTTNTQNQTSSGNDNTVSKVKLPAAGLNITIAILIALGVVIGTASFLRYKKIQLK